MGKLSPRRRALAASDAAPVDDDILTAEELAEWLKCSPKWIEKIRGIGGGPPFLVLGNWLIRYSRRQVLEWLESERQFTDTSQYKIEVRPGRGRPRQK
jgi:hypothetical protein